MDNIPQQNHNLFKKKQVNMNTLGIFDTDKIGMKSDT